MEFTCAQPEWSKQAPLKNGSYELEPIEPTGSGFCEEKSCFEG